MMRVHKTGFTSGRQRVAQFALSIILGLLLSQAAAWSGEWADADFPAWQVVGDEELNAVRGGFMFSNGVQVDIGIKKAAFINGFEEFRNSFKQFRTYANVSERMRSRMFGDANSVLQVGTGNALSAMEITSGSTFIQNTLDNQLLGNFTVVDVRIRNLDSALRQLPVSAFPAIRDFAIPGLTR